MKAQEVASALDCGQIKKAAQALLAYNASKQKSGEKVLLNIDQNVFLMVTVWKIPPREQVIKITLPHSVLPAASEICLFTKDEPGLTAEQTAHLYKKLLDQHGITSITEIIPYKTLKSEYKPFEAKRRLLGRCNLFLSDDRIRRLLPSHLGKNFYQRKKAPLSVNLKAKNLAKEIGKHTQGTILPVTNKGCCYSVRIGTTSMGASEITENVMRVAEVMAFKAPKIWKSVKILHLKTDSSVALPVYNSAGPIVAAIQKRGDTEITQKGRDSLTNSQKKISQTKKTKRTKKTASDQPKKASEVPKLAKQKAEEVEEEEEEEIPQLVPIEASSRVKKQQVCRLARLKVGFMKEHIYFINHKTLSVANQIKPQVAASSSDTRKELEKDNPTVLGKRKRALLGEALSRQPKTSGDALNVKTSKAKIPNPQHPSASLARTPKMVKTSKSVKKPSRRRS